MPVLPVHGAGGVDPGREELVNVLIRNLIVGERLSCWNIRDQLRGGGHAVIGIRCGLFRVVGQCFLSAADQNQGEQCGRECNGDDSLLPSHFNILIIREMVCIPSGKMRSNLRTGEEKHGFAEYI